MSEEKQKRTVGTPFQKGDPRINRKGRPKSFDAVRELAQSIAHGTAMVYDKKGVAVPLVIDGEAYSRVMAILSEWATSKDFRKQQAFLEYAFGKVPDEQNLNVSGELSTKVIKGVDPDEV